MAMFPGAIGMTKLKNRFKKVEPEIEFHIKNVNINGVTHGCSGFIVDAKSGRAVYVSTDVNHGISSDKVLYRNAKHTKDFRGKRNRYTYNYDVEETVEKVLELLSSDDFS